MNIFLLIVIFIGISFDGLQGQSGPALEDSAFNDYCILSADSLEEEVTLKIKGLPSTADSLQATKILHSYYVEAYRDYDYLRSLVFIKAEANLWKNLDSMARFADCSYRMANVYYRLSDFYKSYLAATTSLEIARSTNDTSLIIRNQSRLGWTYWRVSRADEAIAAITDYKELSKKFNQGNSYVTRYHNAMANFTGTKGWMNKSKSHGDSAIYYAKKYEDDRGYIIAKSNRAQYYERGDSINHRVKTLLDVVDENEKKNRVDRLGSNYRLLASIYLEDNQFEKSIEYYNKALEIYTLNNDKVRSLHSYSGLAKAYDNLKQYKHANKYFQLERETYYTVYGTKSLNKIFDLEQELHNNRNDQKFTSLAFEKQGVETKLLRERLWASLIASLLIIAFLVLTHTYYRKRQKEKIKDLHKQKEAQETISELERKALKAQMNPHFLFNCLNSIKSYIVSNEPRQATNYLNKFATLIRMILNHSDKKHISLGEELRAMGLYIDLENLRMNHELEYKIDYENISDVENLMIPPMIIQPFIENAIIHGLAPKPSEKKLEILCKEDTENVIVRIIDNGVGRNVKKDQNQEKPNKHKSYGLKITSERLAKLQVYNNENLSFKIVDLKHVNGEPSGTMVELYLPKKYK